MRLNESKLTSVWRKLLRQTQLQQLNDDVTALWQGFERVTSKQDVRIGSLLTQLESAEEQQGMAFKGHVEQVQQLIGKILVEY